MSLQLKHNIKEELRSLFKFSDTKRHWAVPFMAALCLGIPMLVGLSLGHFSESLTVSLGGLVILYLPVNENIIGRISRLLLCSVGFIFAYLIGIFFSFNFYASYISFGVFAAFIYFLSKWVKVGPPGNFFFIMMAAMACGIPYSLEEIPHRIGLMTLGTFLSCFMAIVFSFLVLKPNISKDVKESLSKIYVYKHVDYIEAFIIGIFLSGSFFIAHFLGMHNAYWVPVSCLAVMQGVSRTHTFRRGFYRIVGTAIGMVFCWFILSYFKQPLEIILAIMVLQFTVEMLIVKNYFVAVLFVTPMTILLSEAGNPAIINPDILIAARIKDVLLGSLMGAIGGWVIYNRQLKFHMVRQIRTIKKTIKR